MSIYRAQPDGTVRRWGPAEGYLIVDCPKCGMPRGQVCKRVNGDIKGRVVLCHPERRQAAIDAGWRPDRPTLRIVGE